MWPSEGRLGANGVAVHDRGQNPDTSGIPLSSQGKCENHEQLATGVTIQSLAEVDQREGPFVMDGSSTN